MGQGFAYARENNGTREVVIKIVFLLFGLKKSKQF